VFIALALEQFVRDPISHVVRLAENKRSDLFWAFHPNRVIVPSIPSC